MFVPQMELLNLAHMKTPFGFPGQHLNVIQERAAEFFWDGVSIEQTM
jgi:hypothetical protein